MAEAKKTETAAKKIDLKKLNFIQKLKDKKNTTGTNTDRSGLWGKIGFTLALVSAGTWLIPILGLAVSTVALVFNILGLKVTKGRWFAVAGLTLTIITLNMTFIYGFYNVLVSMLGGGA